MYETIFVDGVDLSDIIDCITSLDGIYQTPATRGDNLVIPGVDGEIWLDKPIATSIIELGLMMKGDTTTKFNDGFRILRKRIPPGKLLHLQRRMSYSIANETHEATGEYASGLNPTMQLMRFGKTTLGLRVHSGLWYATSDTCFLTSVGTELIKGEIRTHRMTILMNPNATVSNTTTGHSVTMNVPGGGADVVIDVEAMTALQGTVDVSYAMTWSRRLPMRLAPGNNVFTGDIATICYRAAYQ